MWVAYIVMGLYCLPLFGIMLCLVASHGFATPSWTVVLVDIVSREFLRGARDTFGSMIVPLLMAFAVKSLGPDDRVPGRTFALFLVLSVLFVLGVITSGLVEMKKDLLPQFSEEVTADNLPSVARAYPKEILIYIAMTLGISVKKAEPAK